MNHFKKGALALLLLGLSYAGPARADADADLIQQSYNAEAVGKLEDALSALDRMGERRDSYVVQLRRGWLSYRLGRHAQAVTAYQAAVAAAPRSVEARQGMLLPQMAQKRWADVERGAKELLRVDPQNYLGHLRLAFSYYSLHRFADAATHYKKLRELYPGDVEVRSGLGWALLKAGQTKEAEKEFRDLLAISPYHALGKEGLAAAGGK